MNRTILRYILCLSIYSSCGAFPPINLFRPSDRPLMPEPVWCTWSSQTTLAYEGAFHARAFREEEESQIDLCLSADKEKTDNVLQLFHCDQNGLAALKGFKSDTPEGELSQLFNIDDDNGKQGLFRPRGDLSIPLNLMISHRIYFSHGLNLAFHLPFLVMELKNVSWRSLNPCVTGEQRLERDLLEKIQRSAGLKPCSWRRTGIGDFVAQVTWMRDYMQPQKPILKNVRVQGRVGLIFPTGKRHDEDRIVAFPFGSDGAWGVQVAGGLDLSFCYSLRAGLDAEFAHLFGNNRCRRIKSAPHQTDFLFLKKVPAFREFGLEQQYNLYVESYHCWRGLSLKLNYQFLKRNDDRLDLKSDVLSTRLANTAESLRDRTAHSLIAMVRYDFWKELPEEYCVKPALRLWIKGGFNGKRAIIVNSVGVQADIAF